SLLKGEFPGANGLLISAGSCSITGLTIQNFPGNGIQFTTSDSTGSLVRGCTIGGLTGEGNGQSGIIFNNGASNNVVGGPEIQDANLIVGNGIAGVRMSGPTTQANQVLRNRIFRNGVGARGVFLQNGAQDNVTTP